MNFVHPSQTTLSAVEPNGTIVLAASFVEGNSTMGRDSSRSMSSTPTDARYVVRPGRPGHVPGRHRIRLRQVFGRPADGTIDVGGVLNAASNTSSGTVGVIQVTPTGTLDTSFGNQGIATLPAMDPIRSLSSPWTR